MSSDKEYKRYEVVKYPIGYGDTQDIEIPKGGQVLCFQMQGVFMMIWVLIDANEQREETRRFHLLATGHKRGKEFFQGYIGTVQEDAQTIWHLFEETNQ